MMSDWFSRIRRFLARFISAQIKTQPARSARKDPPLDPPDIAIARSPDDRSKLDSGEPGGTLPVRSQTEIGSAACRIVWSDESTSNDLEESSSPWVDAATASALVIDQYDRRSRSNETPAETIEILIVATDRVETHHFGRIEGEQWPFALIRKAFKSEPIDLDDPLAWDRLNLVGDQTRGTRRVVAASPALGQDHRLALKQRVGDRPILTHVSIEPAFAKLWDHQASKNRLMASADYSLSYPRARWASVVPHRETIRSVKTNLRSVYDLARGGIEDPRIAFRLEQSFPDRSTIRRSMISEDLLTNQQHSILSLELDSCPATGSTRFLLQLVSESRAISTLVFWAVAAPEPKAEPSGANLPVSVCLAVDSSTASRAWIEVAPLVHRLRRLGRLARLQVIWSQENRPRLTRGWSPQQFEAAGKSLEIEPPDEDSPDAFPCRGLSGAIREALWLEGTAESAERPSVGLVIVDRDYQAGGDPAFATPEGRWAWFVRMRRIVGGSIALLAIELDRSGGSIAPDLREALGHLVILGRQATTTRSPVSSLKPGQLSERDAIEAEVQSILSVADRMTAPGNFQARTLYVIDPEDGGSPDPESTLEHEGVLRS
jgi:hypothetical protein